MSDVLKGREDEVRPICWDCDRALNKENDKYYCPVHGWTRPDEFGVSVDLWKEILKEIERLLEVATP